MGEIIDCKAIAQKIKDEVKAKAGGKKYKLTVLTNPRDDASKSYVKNKRKVCEEVGIEFEEYPLSKDSDTNDLYNILIENNNPLIIQLPMSDTLSENTRMNLMRLIDGVRDADGLLNDSIVEPATAKGVMKIFDEINYDLQGKHVVLVGRGITSGKPLIRMLLDKNATLTVCHSYTKDLKEFTKQGDVVISCVGKPHLITSDHIKDGAVVINVGLSRDDKNKLVGDVDFENVKEKASYITKNIGGVGLLTTSILAENVVEIYKNRGNYVE